MHVEQRETKIQRKGESRQETKNVKLIQLLKNIGEPEKMKVCDCKKHLIYSGTIDKSLPNGEVESIAVYECTVCGKEFREDEL